MHSAGGTLTKLVETPCTLCLNQLLTQKVLQTHLAMAEIIKKLTPFQCIGEVTIRIALSALGPNFSYLSTHPTSLISSAFHRYLLSDENVPLSIQNAEL